MNNSSNFWQGKNFGTAVLLLVVVGILFVGMKTVNEFAQARFIGAGVPATNTISVTGDGEAFAKPDTATFTFSVEEQASVVAEAQKAVDAKMKKAIDFLKSKGIDEKDIKTASYDIYPNYLYQPVLCTQYSCPPQGTPKIDGYKVSEMIEVKIRDISKAGEILSGVGAVGVMNLSGLNFTVDNEDAIQAEARTQAITKAKAKADELAKELGVSIVRVVNFSESGNYPIFYGKTVSMDSAVGMGGAVAPQAANVAPGQTKITSNVSITYEIR